MKKAGIFLLLNILFLSGNFAQKNKTIALTPPMGWNSWNTFFSSINENLIKEMADSLVASGMKDAGYEYIVIDDCWLSPERDALGNLQADPKKFPHGMKAVGDYIHSKGLKFGMYNCAGTSTCAGLPGTHGHEYQDALSYASWGVDYLKYDWCNTEGINAKDAYKTMSKALAATKRPIVFSLCEWGTNKPWEWAEPIGHLWRTTGDISCSWVTKNMGTWIALGVTKILDQQVDLRKYAGPGHWNDPDMLEVGNGLPINEDRSHFSMWAMLAAPLMAGNDIRKMTKATHDILTNKNLIAVNQDSLGIQALKYATTDSIETWVKPLCGGEWAVCFLNRASQTRDLNFNWGANRITDSLTGRVLDGAAVVYSLTNLWNKAKVQTTAKPLKASILSHDVLVFRLSKYKK